MTPIFIKLPFPSSELNPNRRSGRHWKTSLAAKSQAANDARTLTLEAMRGETFCSTRNLCVEIVFHAPDKRRRDLDNLVASMKPAIDGIANALQIDDSRITKLIVVKTLNLISPRTEITIKEL